MQHRVNYNYVKYLRHFPDAWLSPAIPVCFLGTIHPELNWSKSPFSSKRFPASSLAQLLLLMQS